MFVHTSQSLLQAGWIDVDCHLDCHIDCHQCVSLSNQDLHLNPYWSPRKSEINGNNVKWSRFYSFTWFLLLFICNWTTSDQQKSSNIPSFPFSQGLKGWPTSFDLPAPKTSMDRRASRDIHRTGRLWSMGCRRQRGRDGGRFFDLEMFFVLMGFCLGKDPQQCGKKTAGKKQLKRRLFFKDKIINQI